MMNSSYKVCFYFYALKKMKIYIVYFEDNWNFLHFIVKADFFG